MSLRQLVARSLRFYWRTNAAVLLAVVVATGTLTGAMAVGDSVRYTLRRTQEARLGRTEFAIVPQDRYFRAALADDLAKELKGLFAPALQVSGIITNDDGSRRVNRVEVLGVDDRFYEIGHATIPVDANQTDTLVIGEAVAEKLGVSVGDEVVLLGAQGEASWQTIDAREMAAWIGTIPYEVLCRLGSRVERRYR